MKKSAALILTLGMSLVAASGQALAQAQSFPSKPMRIIVPFPAAGSGDLVARLIAQKMDEAWGQRVIVDNRPGGNTVIGAEAAARSAPDGHTLFETIDSTLVMNQYLYSKLPYDPLKDFAPITLLMWTPIVIVTDAATGPKSVQDLVQRAKANPGKVTYGAGTVTTQLAGVLINNLAGIDMTFVPYKGSAPTVQGLLSNDVTVIIDAATSSVPHIKTGKFRVLTTTGTQPIEALPGLPKLADMPGFPGFDVAVWVGLVAPAGTPADIVAKLHREVSRILALPDVKEKLVSVGVVPFTNASAAEFSAFVRKEADRWGKVIKDARIKLD
ncbi:MAG: tripartite tricarboxylate transporter substrate binding protein [Betaproteobacteria bacterium]|nr:tripartite tricarboxylate transporter substrate binding protein [Betaproteobacteria bacterium]